MAGTTTGILVNAEPLSDKDIKELEKRVVETSSTVAYLDSNRELCFTLPCSAEALKHFAWNNAYEINGAEGEGFTKYAYKKVGLDSMERGKVWTKETLDADWNEQGSSGTVEILEGSGAEFHKFAPTALTFRSTAPLNDLKKDGVKIDGEIIDPGNYVLTEGSTIVTFPSDFLEIFGKGDHEVTVESENSTASGNFTVVEPDLNEYGFYYNIPYYNKTDDLGLFLVVFKDNGTIIYKDVLFTTTKYGSYVMEGNNIVGTLDGQPVTFEVRADGIYSENVHSQVPLTFVLNSLYGAADDDYLYFFDTTGEFYYVSLLNTELTSLDGMKTAINSYPVTTLSWGALQDCDNIIDLVIPNHITKIEANVCGTDSKIRSVVIPDNVKTVAWGAFNDCLQLTDVEIGAGIKIIGQVAFGYCPNLKNVTYKGTTQQWLNVSFTHNAANSFLKTQVSWVRCSDGRVSIFNDEVDNTTPTKNEYGFYYDVPYTVATTVEDAGERVDMLMHAVIKADGTFENYMSVPLYNWIGKPTSLFDNAWSDNIWSYSDGVLTILGQVPLQVSDDGLSLIDVTGALGTFLNVSEQIVLTCTFEDYHDIYFGATYKIHPAVAGADLQDMILNADGSAIDIYGYTIAPAGAITYAPHTITMGELSGLVSMDGTTIFVDMQPIWSTFDHICKFVNQSPSSEYLASEATCQSPAKYYYSCNCGAKGTETFEYGDIGEHNYVDTVCTVCGEVHDCDYTRKYQWDEYLVSEATCTQPAVYKYQCEHGVKGIETFIGDRLKPHNYVDTVCTVCGAKQPGLYRTGTNYTELIATFEELKENDMVKEVSISDTHIVSATYDGRETLAGDLILPNTTTEIGNTSGPDGFAYCDQLTGIIIPDSVTSICKYAFDNCTSLTSVTIGNSVTNIGYWVFNGCTELKSLTIGKGVTAIDDEALRRCIKLENIIVDAENPIYHSVDNSLIETATGTLIKGRVDGVIPENCGITSIGNYAFYAGSFENMIIPDGVTSIGKYAFDDCDELTNLVLPEGLDTINRYAFNNCVSLKDITIPDSVTSIGDSAFDSCTSFTNIVIPDSVTSIDQDAFRGCYNLKSVTIGSNVTHIGENAFNYCGQIASITFNGTMTQWRAISKGASWYSTTLTTYVQCTDGQVAL